MIYDNIPYGGKYMVFSGRYFNLRHSLNLSCKEESGSFLKT
jgi:hypothetical protein